MKKIEAVIFDWAGTTVDFGSNAPVGAFVETFRTKNIEPTLNEVREPMGMLKKEHIRTMLEMPRIKELYVNQHGHTYTEIELDDMYDYYEKSLLLVLNNYAQPKPYVLDSIANLRKRGIKIGSTTGYNDKMMQIVIKKAAENGYAPDCMYTPDSVNGLGRPYPYMIYKNMEDLKISSVNAVIKVGDTVSDIIEGKNAGIISVGVVEGSSIMGLSQDEYDTLSAEKKQSECERVTKVYRDANADYIIRNMSELCNLIGEIER